MVKSVAESFQSLGLTGHDIRHIPVTVFPYAIETEGGTRQGWKAYAGTSNGNLDTCVPTDFIFLSLNPDWIFTDIELNGKNWPGLAIYPDSPDFTVERSADDRSLMLKDTCETHIVFRYQLVLRNTKTNEIAICDPDTNNNGNPGGGGS